MKNEENTKTLKSFKLLLILNVLILTINIMISLFSNIPQLSNMFSKEQDEKIDIATLQQNIIDSTQNAIYIKNRKSYCVPDVKTAVAIADAVCYAKYGKESIEMDKPFMIELIQDTIWHVYGTFPKSTPNLLQFGGIPHIYINVKDGKIIELTHGK